MPVIKKCEEAVGSITKADFAELKNLSNPPTVVKTIVDMLLLMFGIQPLQTYNHKTNKKEPDTWAAFKKFISDPYVINKFHSYDTQGMSKSIYKKLKK